MFTEILPLAHPGYCSLPLLGRTLDASDDWLIERGYRRLTRQCYVIRCKAIESYFRRRRLHKDLDPREVASVSTIPSPSLQCHGHGGLPGAISAQQGAYTGADFFSRYTVRSDSRLLSAIHDGCEGAGILDASTFADLGSQNSCVTSAAEGVRFGSWT
jgi:hypothetical protein